jgi:hypothetical protein
VLIDILRTHPHIVTGGILQENPFFVPPNQVLRELRESRAANSGGRIHRHNEANVPSTQASEEIKRLQGCINDLISVQAFAVICAGQAFLRHEVAWDGHGVIDQPLHHRSAQRAAVGRAQRRRRRDIPLHATRIQ